jgi:hypothetical protein
MQSQKRCSPSQCISPLNYDIHIDLNTHSVIWYGRKYNCHEKATHITQALSLLFIIQVSTAIAEEHITFCRQRYLSGGLFWQRVELRSEVLFGT